MTSNKQKRAIKIIEVSGTPYEMGLQYGKSCPEIIKMIEIITEMFGGKDTIRILSERYLPLYLPPTNVYAPDIVEEMKGIAEGASVDFKDIFFLNITYEIAPAVFGCTSFAADKSVTDNREVVTGQNFDFVNMWEDIMFILKMKPSHGPHMLMMAPAGCLGLIGLNSEGLTLNLNMLRNTESLIPSGGVPGHVILRKALSSENISEAMGNIAAAVKRSAQNYILGTDKGDILDIETTGNDFDVHYPKHGILTHGNHFTAERFRSNDLAPFNWPDSFIRAHRLRMLMEECSGSLSGEIIQKLLQDHNNYPASICRHVNAKAAIPMQRIIKTLVSMIMIPKERKALIALGNPCENEYLKYEL